jgi:hypothetical protein
MLNCRRDIKDHEDENDYFIEVLGLNLFQQLVNNIIICFGICCTMDTSRIER